MGVGGSAATTTPTAATMVLRSPGGWAAALDMDSPHGSAVVDWDKSFEDHHDAPRRLTAVDHRRCCAGRVATAGGCRYVEGRVQGQSASSKRRRSRTCLRNCSALSTKVGLGIMIMVPRYQGSAARSVAGHTLVLLIKSDIKCRCANQSFSPRSFATGYTLCQCLPPDSYARYYLFCPPMFHFEHNLSHARAVLCPDRGMITKLHSHARYP